MVFSVSPRVWARGPGTVILPYLGQCLPACAGARQPGVPKLGHLGKSATGTSGGGVGGGQSTSIYFPSSQRSRPLP